MVQFIRLRGDFGLPVGFGFYRSGRTDGRTASQLLALREAARMVPNCAQPIILAYGTCELSKNFPPFGRRVAVTHIAQNQSRLIALTPL